MNPKLKKINDEYKKNSQKIAGLQARQKELEQQRTEVENMEIVGIVRNSGLSLEELAAFLSGAPARTETQEEVTANENE